MSAIEQALRQIDQQRESKAHTKGVVKPEPINRKMFADNMNASSGVRSSFLTVALGAFVALLAVGSLLALAGSEKALALGALLHSGAAPSSSEMPALTRSDVAVAPAPTLVPTHLDQTAQTKMDSPTPAEGGVLVRAAWLVQASEAWERGAWDLATRLWSDGLRRITPSTLALQIAESQTLDQAQRLHQVWSKTWPVVILQEASPAGPRWMVLALPNPAEVEAAQIQLSQSVGQPVAWASVLNWMTKSEFGQMMRSPAQEPATASAAAAPAPLVPSPVIVAATTAPALSAPKATKPERVSATANAPPALAANATGTAAAAVAVANTPSDPPLVSRSVGESPDDQTRAVMATKAIEMDFSAVEQWLAKADFEKALGSAQRMEEYMGSNWRTRYLAGAALSGLGRWSEAVAALTHARQKNPGNARIALYLAVALQETGDHTAAMDTLLKATSQHPDIPELWLNQGHSLQAQGRVNEAAQAYQRFIELSAGRKDLSQQRVWVTKSIQKGS